MVFWIVVFLLPVIVKEDKYIGISIILFIVFYFLLLMNFFFEKINVFYLTLNKKWQHDNIPKYVMNKVLKYFVLVLS